MPAGVGIVSYVGSRIEGAAPGKRRAYGTGFALAFFLGIVFSILGLGIAASQIGRLLAEWSAGFAVLAGVLSLLAGLAALLAPRLRRHIDAPRQKRGGTIGAFLYGLTYTFATITTGAGALLLVLTIAAAMGRPLYGAALSLAFGIGRGLPFLLLGLFAGTAGAWIGRVDRLRRPVELLSGVALLSIGVYFVWLASIL